MHIISADNSFHNTDTLLKSSHKCKDDADMSEHMISECEVKRCKNVESKKQCKDIY